MINDTIGSQNIPMVVKHSVGETYISWFSEFNNLNYDVYPANDKVMINNIDGITVLKGIIYNSTGQKVFVGQPENSGIDVSGFHPGVYVVEIITREARFRDKLIIR